MKREYGTVPEHYPIWETDFHKEFKQWNIRERTALSLFPWAGISRNTLRVETVDYRLRSFVNISIDVSTGQNKQLSAIRLMILQKGMVLDILTAEKGGVCTIVGTSCHTKGHV